MTTLTIINQSQWDMLLKVFPIATTIKVRSYEIEILEVPYNATVEIRSGTRATLRNNATATLLGKSTATLYDKANATLYSVASVKLYDNSSATLYNKSKARIYSDHASVKLHDWAKSERVNDEHE